VQCSCGTSGRGTGRAVCPWRSARRAWATRCTVHGMVTSLCHTNPPPSSPSPSPIQSTSANFHQHVPHFFSTAHASNCHVAGSHATTHHPPTACVPNPHKMTKMTKAHPNFTMWHSLWQPCDRRKHRSWLGRKFSGTSTSTLVSRGLSLHSISTL
jgi:hypothetical protein